MRVLVQVSLMFVLVQGVSSCCDDDCCCCCPDRFSFIIENSWNAAPGARPEGMAYVFLPEDGSSSWRFDFPGRYAGEVSMAAGNYSFLSYNDDTYNVLFRGCDGYYSYEAYTPETELLGTIPYELRGNELPYDRNERVVRCPDMMWGCAYCKFRLEYNRLFYIPSATDGSVPGVCSKAVLMVKQRQLTARYLYRIENVVNLSGVKSMSASLSGMAGSMKLASGTKGDYPSTLSCGASVVDKATVGGEFCTFGLPGNPDCDNVLNLFVVIKDGRRLCYEFNVTDLIRSAPDPMNVQLILDGSGLEIPRVDSDAGFDVSVDGWDTVVVNIRG